MGTEKFIMETKISQILRDRLAGENLSKIARELGISKSLLADWVSSRRLPSLKNIEAVARLATYLGLAPVVLRRFTAARFTGACSYAEGATTGYLVPIAFLDQARVFRIFKSGQLAP